MTRFSLRSLWLLLLLSFGLLLSQTGGLWHSFSHGMAGSAHAVVVVNPAVDSAAVGDEAANGHVRSTQSGDEGDVLCLSCLAFAALGALFLLVYLVFCHSTAPRAWRCTRDTPLTNADAFVTSCRDPPFIPA